MWTGSESTVAYCITSWFLPMKDAILLPALLGHPTRPSNPA
ncbi:rCG32112 [Rattus norvegicus]|uniref:RCG32112 n=1 Tax=Rattus norvegicus TaxID=10116 RepID=A6JXR5_RAT|nr:rCG32112 [Rattus norvegicus]